MLCDKSRFLDLVEFFKNKCIGYIDSISTHLTTHRTLRQLKSNDLITKSLGLSGNLTLKVFPVLNTQLQIKMMHWHIFICLLWSNYWHQAIADMGCYESHSCASSAISGVWDIFFALVTKAVSTLHLSRTIIEFIARMLHVHSYPNKR